MTREGGQVLRSDGPHLLLYDGVCGLCHGVVQSVVERDRTGVFHFASLQSPVAAAQLMRFGGRPDDMDTFMVVANYRTDAAATLTRARAALFVLKTLGWPWKAAGVLRLIPLALLDRMYDVVARNRYRWCGQRDRCVMPRPEYAQRFLDGSMSGPADS